MSNDDRIPRRLCVIVVGLALAIVATSGVAGAVDVTGCTTITSSGTYELQNDINSTTSGNCIEINANNVYFDGNGHTL
ncbi:MAG: hypothetical protein SXQ77_10925 [Halobacteria archaeon]|nr:hypothetical protein [Halobacteria archaeon]